MGMQGFLLITILLLLGPLAAYAGVDSRIDDHRR
jgi:hypothetical protein